MDYKKKYEDALERMKSWARGEHPECFTEAQKAAEFIFPELAENEDEKVRRAILNYLTILWGNSQDDICGVHVEDAIAWLEKQGDQKSVDKLEPKFKVGDWVVFYEHHNSVYQIERIDNYRYYLRHYLGGTLSVHFDNEFIRLWTIQDAKPGDVLASELCYSIILFKGINDDNNIDFYCDYDFSKIDVPGDRFTFNNGQHYGNVEDSKDFHPATKEQRELLFSKMKEAGYEWDAEKKELRKIEKQGEKPKKVSIWKHWKDGIAGNGEGKQIYLIKAGNTYNLSSCLCFECDYIELSELDNLLVEKQAPKSKWTDEDDYNVQCCIAKAESDIANGNLGRNKILIDWLKSLKQRMEEQQ